MVEINHSYLQADMQQGIKTALDEQHDSIKVLALQDFFTDEENPDIKFTKKNELMSHSYKSSSKETDKTKLIADFVQTLFEKDTKKPVHYNVTHKDFALRSHFSNADATEIIIENDWNFSNGGMLTYTDVQGNAVQIQPQENTIYILIRDKTVDKFISYANHYGKDAQHIFTVIEVKN